MIERTIEYIKYRTGSFDDCFPWRKQNCKLNHVKEWMKLFAYHYINSLRA
ncbi:hypothetical protein [Candidatus Nitrosocosmicus sp. R]